MKPALITLPAPYSNLRGRVLEKAGKLELLEITKEDGKNCSPFWLVFMRDSGPIADAPGRHWPTLEMARSYYQAIKPKHSISPEQQQRMQRARKMKRAQGDTPPQYLPPL